MAKKKKPRKGDNGLQPIMIDVELHKAIEAARRNFGETPNAILRRMLGIDGIGGGDALAAGGRARGGNANGGGWSKRNHKGRRVFLPDGTALRATYSGQSVTGVIAGGLWQVGEARYRSPSAALIANVRSRAGTPVNLNGWRHWEVKLPGAANWLPLMEA